MKTSKLSFLSAAAAAVLLAAGPPLEARAFNAPKMHGKPFGKSSGSQRPKKDKSRKALIKVRP
jgi:hypothetical protein